ncbi:MAG: serine/threonine-protein phosphatase 6 regulatory ankyrin repeat subunit B-like [Francisellaceae bacterium]|nr:serine/threonine-protein phosphatase 6 regulatory ankyrin repeat subunit B-like [Francisellaceae bacterium]
MLIKLLPKWMKESLKTGEFNENDTINTPNKLGETPLIWSVKNNLKDLIRHLIRYNADHNLSTPTFITPLLMGAANSDLDILYLLLHQENISIDHHSINGKTALIAAVVRNQPEMVKMLLQYQASLNEPCYKGITPLMYAIINHHFELMELLVEQGADVNEADKEGKTPLILAVIDNDMGVVDYLINHKARINRQNQQGATALMYAIALENLNMVNGLLSHGAEIDKGNLNNITPLGMAFLTKNEAIFNCIKQKVIEYLANKYYYFTTTDVPGDKLSHHELKKINADIFETLLELAGKGVSIKTISEIQDEVLQNLNLSCVNFIPYYLHKNDAHHAKKENWTNQELLRLFKKHLNHIHNTLNGATHLVTPPPFLGPAPISLNL